MEFFPNIKNYSVDLLGVTVDNIKGAYIYNKYKGFSGSFDDFKKACVFTEATTQLSGDYYTEDGVNLGNLLKNPDFEKVSYDDIRDKYYETGDVLVAVGSGHMSISNLKTKGNYDVLRIMEALIFTVESMDGNIQVGE